MSSKHHSLLRAGLLALLLLLVVPAGWAISGQWGGGNRNQAGQGTLRPSGAPVGSVSSSGANSTDPMNAGSGVFVGSSYANDISAP